MIDKKCKTCGTTLSTFYNTSYLGCPDCYKYFRSEIIGAIGKIQGGARHHGKRPKLSFEDRELLNDYKAYVAEKDRAGTEGRFSDMAKLNKIIADLGEELKRRGLL
ncbi:MAG: hypothetical protein IJY57_03440 [Clostridia bacterium]|nr:hypothetical protein [Clostridia bacterium]